MRVCWAAIMQRKCIRSKTNTIKVCNGNLCSCGQFACVLCIVGFLLSAWDNPQRSVWVKQLLHNLHPSIFPQCFERDNISALHFLLNHEQHSVLKYWYAVKVKAYLKCIEHRCCWSKMICSSCLSLAWCCLCIQKCLTFLLASRQT